MIALVAIILFFVSWYLFAGFLERFIYRREMNAKEIRASGVCLFLNDLCSLPIKEFKMNKILFEIERYKGESAPNFYTSP